MTDDDLKFRKNGLKFCDLKILDSYLNLWLWFIHTIGHNTSNGIWYFSGQLLIVKRVKCWPFANVHVCKCKHVIWHCKSMCIKEHWKMNEINLWILVNCFQTRQLKSISLDNNKYVMVMHNGILVSWYSGYRHILILNIGYSIILDRNGKLWNIELCSSVAYYY